MKYTDHNLVTYAKIIDLISTIKKTLEAHTT